MSQTQAINMQEQNSAQDLEVMNAADSDGLPDYATIDPNDGERSVTPFPRPVSPTPLQFSGMASDDDGGRTHWPLANADEVERPGSEYSYTSAGRYNSTRAKLQARKAKRTKAQSTSQGHFFFTRRLAAAKRSTSNDLGDVASGIPKARLASGRGRLLMQRNNSAGSFSTFTNHRAAPKKPESKQGSGILPQMSQITSGCWSTMGSFFSSSSAVPVASELSISGPFELRHIAGVGSAGAAFVDRANEAAAATADAADESDELKTQSVLMDVRSESRLGNRTSLPVNMPNAISPIDNTVVDVGRGHDTPVRGGVNRFASPASPAATVHHIRPSTSNPAQYATIFHDGKAAFCNMASGRVLFWIVAGMAQTSMLLVAASLAVIVVQHYEGEVHTVADMLFLASVFWLLLSGLILSTLHARRLSGQMVREHRDRQRDEELVEQVRMPTQISNGVGPLQDELAHRKILAAADQETQDRAWDKFASNPNRVRSYVKRLEDEVQRMSDSRAKSNAHKRVSGIFEVVNLQRADPHPDMIGIARSDSLIHALNEDGSPGMPPSVTFQTFETVTNDTAPPSFFRQLGTNENSGSALSEEEETSPISRSVPTLATRIPHSAAVADLSSEANIDMSSSNTKSTISSLIGSYVSDSETRPSASYGRVNEALHSHPIDRRDRPIVTEAGTPNSDKSGDRYRVPDSGSAGDETDWSIRDGVASRLATMTPIEERSESASAYGSR
jgi:hypothetical protein